MKTTIETITPQFAIDILENHNPLNRNVSENVVQAYANDMKNERWLLTHQGIAFDVNGNLVDGQHRLWAVVFSGKEVLMNVTRGLPVSETKNGIEMKTMDAMDNGFRRQTGQQMQLAHGIKNGSQVAAACRGISSMVLIGAGEKRISTTNSLYIYKEYGNDIQEIILGLTSRKRVQHVLAPLAMYHHGEPEKAAKFRNQFNSMEGMHPAVLAYIQYLERHYRVGETMQAMNAMSEAILAFHHDKNIKIIRSGETKGREFIVGMFPSLNKRIADQIKVQTCNVKKIKKGFKK